MKTSVFAAILAPAAVVRAQWWGGAPDCAHSCFSSYWPSANAWPSPTSYCSASQGAAVSSCINSACSATPTAVTSYSSLSSSICAQWSSCSAAGSTSVYTISAPAFTGAWGPGKNGGNGGPGGNGGGNGGNGGNGGPGGGGGGGRGANHAGGGGNGWGDQWTRTWSGGVYTVTGCEWNGNPWAGGPGGWGMGGAGGSPWAPWGSGWTWSTVTKTVTRVVGNSADGATAMSTVVGLAAVAQAVNGNMTTSSIIGDAAPTAAPTATAGALQAAGGTEDLGLKAMAAMLGGVVVVAGLL